MLCVCVSMPAPFEARQQSIIRCQMQSLAKTTTSLLLSLIQSIFNIDYTHTVVYIYLGQMSRRRLLLLCVLDVDCSSLKRSGLLCGLSALHERKGEKCKPTLASLLLPLALVEYPLPCALFFFHPFAIALRSLSISFIRSCFPELCSWNFVWHFCRIQHSMEVYGVQRTLSRSSHEILACYFNSIAIVIVHIDIVRECLNL